MAELKFDRLPPALPAFGKVVTSLALKDVALKEPLIATANNVKPKARKVNAYRRVCGGNKSANIPVCYPQVMAFPLHLHLMGHPDFPLAAMGMVHVSNKIDQYQAMPLDATYDVSVEIKNVDETERGYEFDLVTEFQNEQGKLVWRGITSILSRRSDKSSGGTKKKPPAAKPSSMPELAQWTLKGNLGRRYAMVSGDVNPIHLTGATAKLLGFKRAIIHGMWTLARSAAELPIDADSAGCLEVEFKTPLFLPGKAKLHGKALKNSYNFEVKDANNHKPILAGSWKAQD
ncbi:MAG: MaoC family dehydratase [Oceanococcus sp.]